jgi:hypothetical protein
MAGVGATIGSTGILESMRTIFANAGYPSGGSGLCPPHHGSGNDPRWTLGSGWAVFVGGLVSSNSTNTNPAVFTSTQTGTIVDVWLLKTSGAATYTLIIDGGSATTITPTGTNKLYRHRVTGLANTTHTVSIARATGTAFLLGVDVHGTTGLLVFNGGNAGAQSSVATGQYYYAADVASNGQNDNDGLKQSYGCDLILLGPWWTNDYGTGVTAAAYKTNMQAAITSALATNVNGYPYPADVVLVADIRGYDGAVLDPYLAALYELADTNDLPLVDMMDRWPSTLSTAVGYGLKSDSLHPSAAGYADWATAIIQGLGLLS